MKQPMMSVNTSIQVFSTNSPELVAFVSLPPENRGELTTPSSPEDNVKKCKPNRNRNNRKKTACTMKGDQ